jgi:hypothetical protein
MLHRNLVSAPNRHHYLTRLEFLLISTHSVMLAFFTTLDTASEAFSFQNG